jgi:hypothetical protein
LNPGWILKLRYIAAIFLQPSPLAAAAYGLLMVCCCCCCCMTAARLLWQLPLCPCACSYDFVEIKLNQDITVAENIVVDNNLPNFSDQTEGVLDLVPAGLGVLVMGSQHVDVTRNRIEVWGAPQLELQNRLHLWLGY